MTVDQLVYGPAEVKKALKLRSLAAARGLWNRSDFPALSREETALTVDAEDLRAWWREEKARIRGVAISSTNHESHPSQEATEAAAMDAPPAFDVDWSKLRLA